MDGLPDGDEIALGTDPHEPDTDEDGYLDGVDPDPNDPNVPGDGATTFVRGDASADGQVNITDPVFILNFLFSGGAEPECEDSADGNDDGQMNITDGVFLLGYLFSGAAAPPTPFADCGLDPSDDTLECAAFAPCATE